MSELGESVFDAFNFLNEFLKDVSKLITTVEEKLTNKHLIALGDAATFWDHSRAYYAPGQWMPKYLIRHYTEGIDLESKKHWKVPWLVFFVIYLYPARFRQPVVADLHRYLRRQVSRIDQPIGFVRRQTNLFQ